MAPQEGYKEQSGRRGEEEGGGGEDVKFGLED